MDASRDDGFLDRNGSCSPCMLLKLLRIVTIYYLMTMALTKSQWVEIEAPSIAIGKKHSDER